jgi:hypothetical protein
MVTAISYLYGRRTGAVLDYSGSPERAQAESPIMDGRPMRTRPRNNQKKYGPNIVRAWFDTVFQYVLGRLASQRGYLLRRNWTFRFYNRRLEYIATLGDHMPMSARENLEQFASFFPEVSDFLEAHDRKVGDLTAACATFHEAILRDPRFQEVFDGIERDAPAEFGAEFSSNFGALSDRADFAGALAEYLVDNFADLPGYYATSRLWNRFRDRFVPVMASPEIESRRLETEETGRDLLEASEKLIGLLKAKRSELSLEFDVPYATETTSAL